MDEKYIKFFDLCQRCGAYIDSAWKDYEDFGDKNHEVLNSSVDMQTNAILRKPKAMLDYKNKIKKFLIESKNENEEFPPYYDSLVEGIFEENWGYAGLAEWFSEKYKHSQSAKIIGNKIFFFFEGEEKLQAQTISDNRRDQLKRALMRNIKNEAQNKDYYEFQLETGERVTIIQEVEPTFGIAKKGCESIVFRRYLVEKLTFEEQASRGTISPEMVELFKLMIPLGFNVLFTGCVRTAKTTMLETWLSYYSTCPSLEIVLVEPNPEIPLSLMLPNFPVIELITGSNKDNIEEMKQIILRSDCDTIVMGEARTAVDLLLFMQIMSKGARRSAGTYHTNTPEDICYNISSEICIQTGSNVDYMTAKVASNLDYVFYMVQLEDKSQKRLESVYEIYCDPDTHKPVYTKIIEYQYKTDSWRFKDSVCNDHITKAQKMDSAALKKFRELLSELAAKYPMDRAASPKIKDIGIG